MTSLTRATFFCDNHCMKKEDVEIIYADPFIVIANKAPGLLTVPGRGPEKQDCLIKRLLSKYPNSRIVHRLDQPTSGIVICPQGYEALRFIAKQFEAREVQKSYVAVVAGLVEKDCGEINLPLICDWPNRPRQMVDFEQGKSATTHYTVLQRDKVNNCTRVELKPITGRSHQLRVHMQQLGHPIMGDTLYAPEDIAASSLRLLLHAQWISFRHPETGETIEFTIPASF